MAALDLTTGGSPLAIAATAGKAHVVRYVNASFWRLANRQREDVIGRPIAETMREFPQNGALALLDRVYATSTPGQGVVPASGQAGAADAHSTFDVWPIFGDDQLPAGLIVQMRDTTDLTRSHHSAASDATEMRDANRQLLAAGLDARQEADTRGALNADLLDLMAAREQMEAALQQSEQRYRRIFDTAPVSIWEEDFTVAKALLEELREQGVNDLRAYLDEHPDVLQRAVRSVRIIDVNKESLRLFDADTKQQLITSLETIFVPESLPAFRDELVAVFDRRHTHSSEREVRTVNGDRRDVVFTMAIPTTDSDAASVLVSLMDVTDKKHAEGEARRARADLQEMLMQSPVPIAVLAGPEFVFELVNPAYLGIAGGRDIIGRSILEALPEVAGQDYANSLREVMRTGEPAVGEESLLRLERGGLLQDTYWTFIHAPLRNTLGAVDRVMAISNDVTAQVRARLETEALVASEQSARTAEMEARQRERGRTGELRATINAIADGVAVVDEGGMVTVTNDAMERALGRGIDSEAELQAALGGLALQPDLQPSLVNVANGDRWVEVRTFEVDQGPPDDASSRVVMVRDVTRERAAEQAREAFIGVLSHEMRTPVTTILGASLLLGRQSAKLDTIVQRDLVVDIATEAERLRWLVEDLLVLSRSEQGRLEFDPEPVLVHHAVRVAIAAEAPRFPLVDFVVTAPVLPPVSADATYVVQVIRNYVSNAGKYGPDGAAKVQVVAELIREDVVVRVLDEGHGFGVADEQRLFELFYRSSDPIRRKPGAGIGLYVARALTEVMGGRVWAARRKPFGSEFGFSLPVITEEPGEDGEAVAHAE